MRNLLSLTPEPPCWHVNWPALIEAYPEVRRLHDCPQDPIHHAEGDVGIHTRWVCEALTSSELWRQLPEGERGILFAAAVLHDIAKPECTRQEPDGRITARGHSRLGAIQARNLLWEEGVPFVVREGIAGLIRYHQVPYFLLDRIDPLRTAAEISQTVRCDHLALLAEADVRGRICQDQQRLLDNVTLFGEFCHESGCLETPFAFSSDHTRFLYFREERRHPSQTAHEAFRAEVILMSGLPGVGKDHWIQHQFPDWPVVSLDRLRQEMDIDPEEEQGPVIQGAREEARCHLRQSQNFIWNGTNVSRQLRGTVIDLLAAYQARIRIVYLETSAALQAIQNRQRQARVPEKAMKRIRQRWEVPNRTEAHQVDFLVSEARSHQGT